MESIIIAGHNKKIIKQKSEKTAASEKKWNTTAVREGQTVLEG